MQDTVIGRIAKEYNELTDKLNTALKRGDDFEQAYHMVAQKLMINPLRLEHAEVERQVETDWRTGKRYLYITIKVDERGE